MSPSELQSPCALAKVPSNAPSGSPSSSVNRLVVSSGNAPAEAEKNALESNKASDVSMSKSRMESVKPMMRCVITMKNPDRPFEIVQEVERELFICLQITYHVTIPMRPFLCRGCFSVIGLSVAVLLFILKCMSGSLERTPYSISLPSPFG